MLQRDEDVAAVEVCQKSNKSQIKYSLYIQAQTGMSVIVLYADKDKQKGLKPNFKAHSSERLVLFMQARHFSPSYFTKAFQ